MTKLKTQPTDQSVAHFIKNIQDPQRQEDCKKLLNIMTDITKAEAKMWGESIVGFGSYHYKYKAVEKEAGL